MNHAAIPLPQGPYLEGLPTALDAVLVGELVGRHLLGGEAVESLRAGYIRHKGRDGSLVGWRVRLCADGPEVPVTVRIATLPRLKSEAQRFEGLSPAHSPWIVPAALVEERGVLLIGFPFDRALRWLRKLVRIMRLREIFSEHLAGVVTPEWRISRKSAYELVRYKPERRAVLRWDLVLQHREAEEKRQASSCYLRLHADGSAARAGRMQRAAAGAGVPCPLPLALVSPGFAVESALPGRPLELEGIEAATRVEAAGELLGILHEVAIPWDEPGRDAGDELERCRQAAADLHMLDPVLGDGADAVVTRLAASRNGPQKSVALHGDFHAGQVLFDGDAAALVDFDRSHAGPAAFDLASFEAHLLVTGQARARELAGALARGYTRRRTLPDDATARWYLACALLTMASFPFRELAVDWPERTENLVKMAAETIGGKN